MRLLSFFRPLFEAWERFAQWVRGGPPGRRPPIVWFDDDGVGWREHPNYMDGDAPDAGQHDVWKREMRIFVWRALRDDTQPGVANLEDLGLGRRRINTPVLYPLGMQLAEACRRLGFRELAEASMPEGVTDDQLRDIWGKNALAVQEEAERRFAHGSKIASTWDAGRMGYDYIPDLPECTVKLLTVGPFERAKKGAPLTPVDLTPVEPGYMQFTAIKGGKA